MIILKLHRALCVNSELSSEAQRRRESRTFQKEELDIDKHNIWDSWEGTQSIWGLLSWQQQVMRLRVTKIRAD